MMQRKKLPAKPNTKPVNFTELARRIEAKYPILMAALK